MTPLEKAAIIDKHADEACAYLLRFIGDLALEERHELLQVAKARHILGHYEYGDTNLFEWSDGKVRAAILEELADAVVYQSWLLERAEQKTAGAVSSAMTDDEYRKFRDEWVTKYGKQK